MAQETSVECGSKKTFILGERLEIDLVCGVDMTEWDKHPPLHQTADYTQGVYVTYRWEYKE